MDGIDNLTWLALGTTLTVLGLVLSYRAYTRRGVTAGMRGAAWSLLPLGLALTRTLRLVGNVVEDVARWATGLVFSPTVWLGFIVLAASGVLFVVSGVLRGRRAPEKGTPPGQVKRDARRTGAPAVSTDDDMAEIEAILRRHGIQ